MASWAVTVNDVNHSSSTVPDDCIILGLTATIPWNNPHNLISLEVEQLFYRIKAGIIIPVLFLVGLPANCINMAVFFKQGLKERINLCLFSLALVDLFYLLAIFVFYAERIYTQFTDDKRYGQVYRYMVHNRVIVLFGFGYVHLVLVAIVSIERCICVLFPMRAQRCIPTKALAFVIVFSILAFVCLRLAVVFQYEITCFYEMSTQRMSWKASVNKYYFRNKTMIHAVNAIFYGFCLTVGCPTIVLITTIITTVRLLRTVRWRSQTSTSLSNKEIGVTKMLIAMAVEFVVLCIPAIVIRVAPLFEPRLGFEGVYANSFNLLIGVVEICYYTSSTVNFFVYVMAGSKYRQTFRSLLRKTHFIPQDSITNVTNSSASRATHLCSDGNC